MRLSEFKPDANWTLFLDRDGVLNQSPRNGPVKTPEQFEWIDGVVESIRDLSEVFGKIIIVTNQQAIGKGIMETAELEKVHAFMLKTIEKSGGRIDKVYFCPDPAENRSFCRKPNIGMGLKAKKDFPEIDYRHSVMAGDTINDMRFGKRLKMKTVLVSADLAMTRQNPALIDMRFDHLKAFARFFTGKP